MNFKKLPDNLGLVYMPECIPGKKKHPCPDCFSCQWCGKERCCLCKGKPFAEKAKPQHSGKKKK